MNYDTEHFSDDELESVRQVMAYFNCPADLAKTIMQSGKMNGNFESIKKTCRDNNARRENANA